MAEPDMPQPPRGVTPGHYQIAAKLRKARGVQRGIPDVLVLANGVCLFIELKALKGRLSPEQIEVGQKIRANGFGWEVCRSLTEVDLACRKHGIELRGRLAA